MRKYLPLLLLILLLAACDSSAPAPNLPTPDLLKQALGNMKALNTYHLNEKGVVSNVQVTLDGDFDVAGKRYSFSENYVQAGQQLADDVIIIGNDRYTRNHSGSGNALFTRDISGTNDLATTALTGMWGKAQAADVDKAATNIKDGNPASEQIDGTDSHHLTMPIDAIPGLSYLAGADPVSSTMELWISTDANPTVRQMRLSGKLAQSNTGNFDLTLKWSKFNAPLTIQPPAGG